jgi:hypothetical protein
MLIEEFPPRDPLEKPPPDPPLAFANESVGIPMSAATIQTAMRFEIFNMGFLSQEGITLRQTREILAGLSRENLIFAVDSRQDRRIARYRKSLFRCRHRNSDGATHADRVSEES